MKKKICHLTSAHPRYDVRIFEKECASLSEIDIYDVILFVADGRGFEESNGVVIHDIGKSNGRFYRFFIQPFRLFFAARKCKANVYHFHDPELLFTGFALKMSGKKVVYDVHEDVPKSLLGREWLPRWMLRILAFTFKLFEDLFSCSFSGIVAATPAIAERFKKRNSNTVIIQNLPEIKSVSQTENIDFATRDGICYTGAISKIRGIIPLLDALSYCRPQLKLHLAGSFIDANTEREVKEHPNFHKVVFYGQLKRAELQNIYRQSFAGLVTFLPLPNHIEAQPNKFFEYMAAGLPLIVSDFPMWKSIVEENEIGLCINPQSPKVIAAAINKLDNNRKLAENMGTKGAALVLEKYNWEQEKLKLFNFYDSILTTN